MVKVLVCGGRDYLDYDKVKAVLDNFNKKYGPVTQVIHGAARGADTLGKMWAETNGIPDRPFPADWDRYKKAAGHLRNRQMLEVGVPDIVIAFLGGKGTANMIDQSVKAFVPVYNVPLRLLLTPKSKPDFDFRTYMSERKEQE